MKTIRPRLLVPLLGLCATLASTATSSAEPGTCPNFTTDGAVLTTPPADPDLEVGSYGFAHQRIQGAGIDVSGEVVTATVTVEDMQRRVMPGYQTAFWVVEGMLGLDELEHRHDGPYRMFAAYYDLAEDRFRYVLSGTDILPTAVSGQVMLGPGGGVQISATFDQLALPDDIDVLGDIWAETGASATYGLSIRSTRWLKEGPAAAPLVPCPGVSLEAGFTGAWYTAQVRGWVLPQGVEIGVVEELIGDSWQPLETVVIDELGRYDHFFELPRATHVLRLRVSAGPYGELFSPTVTVSP